MKFKARKVTRANGEVEFRLCLTLSADEAENAPRIADDPSLDLNFHRCQGTEDQKADWVLMWARILAFWAAAWEAREKNQRFITQSVQKRRKPATRRSRKRRRKG